jgi:hypothetical protein
VPARRVVNHDVSGRERAGRKWPDAREHDVQHCGGCSISKLLLPLPIAAVPGCFANVLR